MPRSKNYRKIWETYHKACILPNMHIHHIDGNHSNNDPLNLLICTPEEHWKLHYDRGDVVALHGKFIQKAGCQGKPHTEESKLKISNSRKGITPWNKGVKRPKHSKKMLGENNPMYGKSVWGSKSEEERQEIRTKLALAHGAIPFQIFKNGELVGEYISKKQCERELGIKTATINKMLKGQDIKNRKGYTVKYK